MSILIKSKAVSFIVFLVFCSSTFCQNKVKRNKVQTPNEILTGKVIKIIDGDTYDLLVSGNITIRIRMDAIDAPERGMPYYKVAKNFLGSLCFQKNIRVVKYSADRNKRLIAKSYLDNGTELGTEMIKNGLAWHFKKYSTDKTLADLEIIARQKKIGLWSDLNPIAPWEVRKLHKKGISTKNYFKNKTAD